MTNKEFYQAVINAEISDELTEYAEGAIAKIEAANEKKRNAPKKEKPELVEFRGNVLAKVSDAPTSAAVIAGTLGVSTQKVSSALTYWVKNGKVAAADGKVDGKSCKIYTLVSEE